MYKYCMHKIIIYTLLLFNIAMENCTFIDDFPVKTSIYKGFSMAMLNNQMVYIYIYIYPVFVLVCTKKVPMIDKNSTAKLSITSVALVFFSHMFSNMKYHSSIHIHINSLW